MLHKRVSIGLFALLLCHTLACAIVGVGSWWQAEDDLSEKLLVYRSADSLVEFQIPLTDTQDGTKIARTTEAGFRYRGHSFSVVSLEILGDTLHVTGLESQSRSFWQSDLLSFLNDHLDTSSDSGRRANQLLKLLLKEYSSVSRLILRFLPGTWYQSIRIPDAPFAFSTRLVPVHCPPPERPA